MKRSVCLSLVLVFLTANSHADIVIGDTGVGGAIGVNSSVVSDLSAMLPGSESQVAAGSATFDPAYATIDSVEWTGIYEGGSAPAFDDFTINFYNFTGSGPTELVYSFDLGDEVNRTASGIDNIYDYSAQIEISTADFPNNFLYMSIQNNTAGDDVYWSWGALTPAGCSCITDTWIAESINQIEGGKDWSQLENVALDYRLLSAVPEPTSYLLFCGVAGVLLSRRRRS